MTGDLPDFLKRVALAFGLSVLLMALVNAQAVMAMHFPDPDDVLRLVQLRDLLGGQGWYDMVQHRIDPAHGGVAMHWSRMVDLPLAAVVLVLRPLLGASGAELAALLIVPMATLAVVQVLVARVAWERLGAEETTLACLTLVMSMPLVSQIRPLRIDHHGWQVATAMLAMNGLMTRHARAGGWISGGALALGLSISLESLPLTLVFALLGAWRWLKGGQTRDWLIHFVQALAVISLLCFAAMRGTADLANHCDAVSPVHLAVFAWGAVALGGLGMVRRNGWVVAGFALIGAVGLALYLGLAPQCRAGSFGMVDPLVRSLWLERVDEGLPIWRQDAMTVLQNVIPPFFALAACAMLVRRTRGDERIWWQEYTLLLAGALAIAMLVIRAGAVVGALSAVPLAWLMARWLAALRQARPGRKLLIVAGIALAILPALPVQIHALLAPHPAAPAGQGSGLTGAGGTCDIAGSAPLFAALPRGTILSPFDIGPALLLSTPESVLATAHHRGVHGMHDTIAAFIGTPDQAQAIVQADHIAYVALCPAMTEILDYAHDAPDGLAARLIEGRAPGWLIPVAAPPGNSLRLWRVKDQPARKVIATPFMQ